MVDCHYDLLSICYVCYLKNDYSKIETIAHEIKKSGNDMRCIFANLYFMSIEEMKDELHPNYYNNSVSILEMFNISKSILEYYLPNIEFIYSIEGMDYVNINDLPHLYEAGLRSIIPVWNNENKYGSGYKSDKGLTKEGIDLINTAIELGIGIDLSHANENTFNGITEVIKQNKKLNNEVICYASHSNSKTLCKRFRNLSDEQLKIIKDIDGLVGIFSNRNFVCDNYNLSNDEIKLEYLKHIMYIVNIVGIDNVMLSTDDMEFLADYDKDYLETSIFDYSNIVMETKKLLLTYYNLDDTNKIMCDNAYTKIINKLNKNIIKKCK